MALKTNYPTPEPPKEPQKKDQLPTEHDTTSGPTYGTTEGVKDPEGIQAKADQEAFEKQKAIDEGLTKGPVEAKK
jgi:hypothetical protein